MESLDCTLASVPMPPRPFPFPLRVGTDICSITRIQKILYPPSSPAAQPKLERFLPKLLTWPERRYFWDRFKSAQHSETDRAAISQYLAGRWAAKEACRKACEHLGTSNGFHSIMILPITSPIESDQSETETSRPQGLLLRKRLPERMTESSETPGKSHPRFDADSVSGQFCEVSISHDREWATAVAIAPVLDGWKPDT